MTKEKKKAPSTKIGRKYPPDILAHAEEDRREDPVGTKAIEEMFSMSLEEFYYLNSIGQSPVPQHIPLKPGDVEVTFFRKVPKLRKTKDK